MVSLCDPSRRALLGKVRQAPRPCQVNRTWSGSLFQRRRESAERRGTSVRAHEQDHLDPAGLGNEARSEHPHRYVASDVPPVCQDDLAVLQAVVYCPERLECEELFLGPC